MTGIMITILLLSFMMGANAYCSISRICKSAIYMSDDISKAQKTYDRMVQKKEEKIQRKIEKARANSAEVEIQASEPEPPKSFAAKTIWGQNIINCRSFNIDGLKKFEFLGSFKSEASIPIYPVPEIAFIGRSNVGKSSLLNSLTGLNKNVAVEGKTAGRTQSINLFRCADKEGDICIFVDLPGYGFAKMSKTQQAEVSNFLRDYLAHRTSLRLAVLLVDIRREAQILDDEMMNFLNVNGVPFVVVATKADKLKRDELSKAVSYLQQTYGLPKHLPIPCSSVTGDGRKSILHAIKGAILGKTGIIANPDEDEVDDKQDGAESDDYDQDNISNDFYRDDDEELDDAITVHANVQKKSPRTKANDRSKSASQSETASTKAKRAQKPNGAQNGKGVHQPKGGRNVKGVQKPNSAQKAKEADMTRGAVKPVAEKTVTDDLDIKPQAAATARKASGESIERNSDLSEPRAAKMAQDAPGRGGGGARRVLEALTRKRASRSSSKGDGETNSRATGGTTSGGGNSGTSRASGGATPAAAGNDNDYSVEDLF